MRQAILAVGLSLVVGLSFSTSVMWARSTEAAQEQKLSKKQLKSLVANARTPSDHQRLAVYYRQKAQQLLKESKEHEDLTAAYANKTVFETKDRSSRGLVPPLSRPCVSFCESGN